MARHYVLCFIHPAGFQRGDVNHAGQLRALQTAPVRLVDTETESASPALTLAAGTGLAGETTQELRCVSVPFHIYGALPPPSPVC